MCSDPTLLDGARLAHKITGVENQTKCQATTAYRFAVAAAAGGGGVAVLRFCYRCCFICSYPIAPQRQKCVIGASNRQEMEDHVYMTLQLVPLALLRERHKTKFSI